LEIIAEKNKRTGLIGTVIFHLVLLLLFAFFGMTYLEPPPEEEGITINFGTSDVGQFDQQTKVPTEENTPPTETVVTETKPQETVEEEILTQDIEEAPAIDKKEKKKEEVKEVVKEEKEKPQPNKQAMEAIERWKDNKNNKSGGGDGDGKQTGDQGNIDGDPKSKNYHGGGAGNGISFTLAGRSMLSAPSIKDNSQEEGKVVVDIIVDKYGKVIRATAGARGSTTASSTLYKKAREAALRTKFNANPDVAEEQKGQMTFIFILN